MINRNVVISLLFLSSCCSFAAHLNGLSTTPLDGKVSFYGKVINSACTVHPENEHQIVRMGQVRSNQFLTSGSWADPTAFEIWLEGCDSSVSQTVGVFFSGSTDSNDPQVFQAGEGIQAAKGVGIGIFDSEGNLLLPGGQPLWYTTITSGKTVLSYTAKYRSTLEQVTPGDASAKVWFSLQYP